MLLVQDREILQVKFRSYCFQLNEMCMLMIENGGKICIYDKSTVSYVVKMSLLQFIQIKKHFITQHGSVFNVRLLVSYFGDPEAKALKLLYIFNR